MTEKLSDEVKKSFISKIPLNRFGEPAEVANAVAFLLSDYSSYITGETLKINGGMYM
jgi:3-oxoacyl-[acyl-carrier protein] reductase